MTPQERIENAKSDAQDHFMKLPDFMTPQEKSNEYFKYMALRLCDHIDEMGRVIAEFEKCFTEIMNKRGVAVVKNQ